MILTVWRHGEAGRAATDFDRALTDRGRADVGFGAVQFHKHCASRDLPHPDQIRFSPLVRTQQTAELVSGAFTRAIDLVDERIQSGAGVADALALLQEVHDADRVEHLLLVSHQPLVSRLIDALLGDPGRVAPLTPGGFAVLTLHAAARGFADLNFWCLPPDYGVGV